MFGVHYFHFTKFFWIAKKRSSSLSFWSFLKFGQSNKSTWVHELRSKNYKPHTIFPGTMFTCQFRYLKFGVYQTCFTGFFGGNKKRETHVFLSSLLMENSVLSWALTFILWRFSALPTSRYQSVRCFGFRGRSPAQFLEKAAFTSYIPKNQCMTIPLRLQNTAQMQL